jgi:hypothetical protein
MQQQPDQPSQELSDGPTVRPTDGKVKLTAKGERVGSGIRWSLDPNDNWPPNGKVSKIDVPSQSGPCEITIKIKMDNPDVTFDPTNPLSASEVGCPAPGSGIETDQIDPKSIVVSSNGKKLSFVDLNEGNGRIIHYALNFVGADPFDPIIRNGGSFLN